LARQKQKVKAIAYHLSQYRRYANFVNAKWQQSDLRIKLTLKREVSHTFVGSNVKLLRHKNNNKKKLAALSMLHKAKKAYYACDVIRFLVP